VLLSSAHKENYPQRAQKQLSQRPIGGTFSGKAHKIPNIFQVEGEANSFFVFNDSKSPPTFNAA